MASHHSIAVGTAGQVVYQTVADRSLSWPEQIGVIPRRADSFQHRVAVVALETAAVDGGTIVLGQVITGMGGVGKTQLAAHYARQAWQTGRVDLLVWVTASTRSAIVTGYAQAGKQVTGNNGQGTEASASAFLAWLEPKTQPGSPITGAGFRPCRWLVVLDDVADPADLNGLWPPESPHGRVLVTTRRRDAALTDHKRCLINVGLFTPTESVAYLTTRLSAHGRDHPPGQLLKLASDLGHLPLALSQAVAYLIDADLDCEQYRELLTSNVISLADLTPETPALPDDQAATVAAAWSLSLKRAAQMRPEGLAQPMLQLASALDPNGIPAVVLTGRVACAYLTRHRVRPDPGLDARRGAQGQEEQSRTLVQEAGAEGSLRSLHRLSLIDHTPNAPSQSVRVHQLIQRAIRDSLEPGRLASLSRTAADALMEVWPEIERDTDLAQALRANVDALAQHAGKALYVPTVHPVLYRSGHSVGEGGQPSAAVRYFETVSETARTHLGAEHVDTLAARSSLARWRGEAGDPAGAAKAFAALQADRTRALGSDDPRTLATRIDLVHWQGRAGDSAGAAAACETLLLDVLRVLGPEHPDTLLTRHNAAWWQGRTENPTGAADAFQHLLADAERILGPDHHKTMSIRNDLAHWLSEAGDSAGALAVLEQSVEHTRSLLGPGHLDALTARSNLARCRGQAGDPSGAVQSLTDLLADRTRILGSSHPHTLATRNDLAFWRGQDGNPTGAVRDLTDLLADRTRILGRSHPHTLTTRRDLAHWQHLAGDPIGAIQVLSELLVDQERVLGTDNPYTAQTRTHLARWRAATGTADRAP
ncbi:FxSxx-COOH system tetratricopeptide repeat protein [Streptomyces sp. NBC_00414]|uniref:FxSxx-COOH system tetratricopeptide repeat protein n=1 Tax=Streptomyces sp. NBC_00414 TaxID=2975739 RepID=UPI002E1ED4DF